MTNPYQPPEHSGFDPSESVPNAALGKEAKQALAFSIGGLCCCAPFGLVGALKAREVVRTIDSMGSGYEHRSLAVAAMYLGYAAMGLFVLGIVAKILSL